LGGEPGIGKSTLALQMAAILPYSLYISGEESTEQIKLRAERLKISTSTLKIGNATNVDNIIATIKQNKECRMVTIDSIQTIYSDEVEGGAGNINQVRACTTKLLEVAKMTGKTIILIGQVTKDGAVAGPKTLEHLVDAVLYLEGDKYHLFRILRTTKNRFGATDEIGVFSMESHGLEEVKNPSVIFLAGRGEAVPGSTVTCLMEGSRSLLVEIQALVTKTNFGYPQRRASGFDLNRLQVLVGVLTKRADLPLDAYDIFLNVVGGIEASEPAADLAVILALASALKNKTISKDIASFGEVGLGGEIRPVSQTEKRLNEIKKMGFKFAVVPHSATLPKIADLKIASVKNVRELVEQILK
jgi:DNA repair protein RadA/Sms